MGPYRERGSALAVISLIAGESLKQTAPKRLMVSKTSVCVAIGQTVVRPIERFTPQRTLNSWSVQGNSEAPLGLIPRNDYTAADKEVPGCAGNLVSPQRQQGLPLLALRADKVWSTNLQ
jgi:hypothetical protein